MAQFPGVVTLEDDRVPVTIGLDSDVVRLASGDVEIGNWPAEECVITDNGDGSWLIHAEDDSLPFEPEDPGTFAESLLSENGSRRPHERAPSKDRGDESRVEEGPEPRPVTVAAFYALAFFTAILGAWAVISLVL